MSAGLARTDRVEAKITPMERAALAERRGDMTESDAIRAALTAWCASSPDSALDQRLVDLVEQAVARGFVRAMGERTAHKHTTIVHADPIAQEERAAIFAAGAVELDETLAPRLGLTVSQLAALRGMKASAPRLNDEQRAALGLAPRQLQLPVDAERRSKERRVKEVAEPGASTVKVRQTKRGGKILVADERTAERREVAGADEGAASG
jgi:hypothetical protein